MLSLIQWYRIFFIEGKIAKGVQLIDGHQLFTNCELVLSCGARRTPQLLMLSGIGPKAELDRFGIHLVAESPDIGHNFFDHLSLHQTWKLRGETQGIGVAAGQALFNKPEYAEGLPV